ncbi:MAG: SDR family oxidoreductase [Burkholderiaceae bacterium]
MSANGVRDRDLPRRALVTGGAAGIGWAICRALAADGVRCAIADIDGGLAHRRAHELVGMTAGDGHAPGGGRRLTHIAIPTDLADPAAAARLCAQAADALGGLDIVINNAGVTETGGEEIARLDPARFGRVVSVNLDSVSAICEHARDRLDADGVIVNIASGAAWRPIPLRGAYSASKAAVVALTEALAQAWGSVGPRLCAIAPGFVRTDLVDTLVARGRLDLDAIVARIPLGRLIEPDDIAAAARFACSPEGGALHGRTLLVDGGSFAAAGAPLPVRAPVALRDGTRTVAIIGDGALADAIAMSLDDVCRVVHADSLDGLQQGFAPDGLIAVMTASTGSAGEMLRNAQAIAAGCRTRLRPAAGFSLQWHCELTGLATPGARAAGAALEMFARTLALEWAPDGWRVNAVSSDGRRRAAVAGLASFLAGPAASAITATAIDTRVSS